MMHILTRRNLIIGGVLIVAVIAVAVIVIGVFFPKISLLPQADQKVAKGEPIDVVLDFYEPWLKAAQATSTDPYKLGLAKSPILSKTLRQRLVASAGHAKTDVDPVLCQTTVPAKIATRLVSEGADQAQVLVVSTDTKQTAQAVVTLIRHNEGWYINDISCAAGEFGPQREFSFDREGYLLKSVPPPYNPKYWHLVFVENDQPGHVAPLFFSTNSMCTALDGSQSVCDPSTFINPSKAHVQGDMTESGVQVKRLELVK